MIRVSEPSLIGNERKYLMDCIDSNWITMGPYVERLEAEFAKFCGTKLALATVNGTVALHLILKALGLGPGDTAVVPNITYVATANAVAYCGATPVFSDVDEGWCMDPEDIRRHMTPKTKAIIPVHLYGLPCDMDKILSISKEYDVPVVEDSAEAFGAFHRERPAGSMGAAGMFSMYGNKIITSSEGGMIVTDDADLHAKMKTLRGQGWVPTKRYWHAVLGYNYRMTDLQAAVGLGQIEMAGHHIAKRKEVFEKYSERLKGVPGLSFQPGRPNATHVRWMVAVVFEENFDRNGIADKLMDGGVETRPTFPMMTKLPMYREPGPFPRSERISSCGLCLPTHSNLTDGDIDCVCERLKEAMAWKYQRS